MATLVKVVYLDKEEKDLDKALCSIDMDAQPSPTQEIQQLFKEAAVNFVKQDVKMNIRINSSELEKIKKQAEREGLKYQSFIKSILHRYITGQLVDAK